MMTNHAVYLAYISVGLVAALMFLCCYLRSFDRHNEASRYILLFALSMVALYSRGLYMSITYPRPLDPIVWTLATVFNAVLIWQLRLFRQSRGAKPRSESQVTDPPSAPPPEIDPKLMDRP
jgi:hypothetical protein